MAYQKLQVQRAAVVTPRDTVNIPYVGGDGTTPSWPCVLYIGGSGNIRVQTEGGDDVVFTGVLAGTFLPVNVVRVFATNTTATNIVALW
jgi:hypothetical protein